MVTLHFVFHILVYVLYFPSVYLRIRSRTVTEVHPLVHEFQHKSYRTADTDLFKSFQNRDGITNIKVQHGKKLRLRLFTIKSVLPVIFTSFEL